MTIKIENLNYTYSKDTAYEINALKDVNLSFKDKEFVGIIGHTGSGKSTLIQHLNGLLKATSGDIFFNDKNIYDKDYKLSDLRKKVGLVFQYPEHQLFETDVIADVCFGPKNLGYSNEVAKEFASLALESVGIRKELYKKSPFELSGGQKRRVAIAGVLAMNPEVLILDEPTAGLDPRGRDKILDRIKKLQEEREITVILVSHSMEDIAKYADRIIVMNNGSVCYDDLPKKVFENYKELTKIGLGAPQVTYVLNELKEEFEDIDTSGITIDEVYKTLKGRLDKCLEI